MPAVEISAIDDGQRDLHILGYAVDHADPALAHRLETYREDRRHRADAMTAALLELGFTLDTALLRRQAARGAVGRPHLAQAVVAAPHNARRLIAEDCADPSTFLEVYLAQGRPAFRPRTSPSVSESIDAIHDAGGVAIWAHPFFNISDPEEVLVALERFRGLGIDGVECFYVTHTREQTILLADECEQRGLLSTGSSDFHGPAHRDFSRFLAFSTFGRAPTLGPIAA